MNNSDYQFLFDDAESTPEYWATRCMLELSDAVSREIDLRGLSKKDFAAMADIHPSYLSRVLTGSTNITIQSITKLAVAVGLKPEISLTEIKATQDLNYSYEDDSKPPTFQSFTMNIKNGGLHTASNAASYLNIEPMWAAQ